MKEFRAARSALLVFLSTCAFFFAIALALAVQRGLTAAGPFFAMAAAGAVLVVFVFKSYRIRCEGDWLEYRWAYGRRRFDLRQLTGVEIDLARRRQDPTAGLYLASGPKGRFERDTDLVINIKPLSPEDIRDLLSLLEARLANPSPG